MPGLEGTKLGRYRLQQRLGHGGMSEVYLAYDGLMRRNVAIKVMSSTHADYIERFQREAEAIGNLHHDNILPAYDYGVQVPWHYLVMPYIEHENLGERLERGPLTLEEAGNMLSQIASGLQFAHEHGILHRDIKPSNILLRDDHHAYLADFGLAKAIDGTGSVTQTGVLMGTPEYMAPELADGPASTSSDLYALGILLYQMVTGQLPFTGETALAVYLRQMHEQPVPPSRLNPAISQDVEQVILRALDKDPRRRFQTPNELAEGYLEAVYAKMPLRGDVVISRTLTPRMGVTLSDSGEMPSLYNKPGAVGDELAQARDSHYALIEQHDGDMSVPQLDSLFDPAFPVAVKEEKLVLSPFAHANAEAPISADKTIVQQPSSFSPKRRPVRRTIFHHARDGRNRFIVVSLMSVSIMLIIVSVVLYAIFNYNSSRQAERVRDLTAPAVSTSQSNEAHRTQTPVQVTPVATATLSPQQAENAIANAITSGTPLLVDDLSTNFISDWNVDNNSCVFTGGAYHVVVKQVSSLSTCESNTLSFDNAALQVDVSLLSGNNAGLIFRAGNQQFYDFEIDNQGDFFFRRHDPNGTGGGTFRDIISATKSRAIAPGKQKNTLLVIAKGSDFKLFINGIFVGERFDDSYTGGQVGFDAQTNFSAHTSEASFSNFKVFAVPS